MMWCEWQWLQSTVQQNNDAVVVLLTFKEVKYRELFYIFPLKVIAVSEEIILNERDFLHYVSTGSFKFLGHYGWWCYTQQKAN